MGFQKAKNLQGALKIGVYGPAGAGKTATSLCIAEGLAALSPGRRIKVVDTENGSNFYADANPLRLFHPAAFDFDALYTKSLTEVIDAIHKLTADDTACLIIDSMTHLWEGAQASFGGKLTSEGTIPIHAWGKIKKPYKKDIVEYLMNAPYHVFLVGRQGIDYAGDEVVGYKMKAESETPYEPNVLIRMQSVKPSAKHDKSNRGIVTAFVEKDRSGILEGAVIENPTFDTLGKPLLAALAPTHGAVQDSEADANRDAEAIARKDADTENASAETMKEYLAKMNLAKTPKDLKAVGTAITPAVKKTMLPADVAALGERYSARMHELKG